MDSILINLTRELDLRPLVGFSESEWNQKTGLKYSMSQIIAAKSDVFNVCIVLFFFVFFNHHAPVSQANWCNKTLTNGNLFHSQSCIGVTRVKPPRDSNPRPQYERQMTH